MLMAKHAAHVIDWTYRVSYYVLLYKYIILNQNETQL